MSRWRGRARGKAGTLAQRRVLIKPANDVAPFLTPFTRAPPFPDDLAALSVRVSVSRLHTGRPEVLTHK